MGRHTVFMNWKTQHSKRINFSWKLISRLNVIPIVICTCMHAQSLIRVLLFANPMNYSPPGSSVHGILQARILEWATMPSPRGIFLTQGSNQSLLLLLHWQAGSLALAPLGSPNKVQQWELSQRIYTEYWVHSRHWEYCRCYTWSALYYAWHIIEALHMSIPFPPSSSHRCPVTHWRSSRIPWRHALSL